MTPLDAIRKPVVLVVEDEPEVADLLARIVREAGCEPVFARDGESALDAARELPAPDLALVDLELPGMDGRSFIAALRADPSLSGIPVVVVSGAPDARLVLATDNVPKTHLRDGLGRVLSRLLPDEGFPGGAR